MLSSNLVLQKSYRIDTRSASDTKNASPTRMQIGVWGLLLIISITLSVQGFQLYQVGAHFDDARYVILARSLISAEDYGMIYLPGPPQTPFYPFGYPLLLAPIALLFPDNFNAWRAQSLLATVMSAVMLFWGWHYFSRRSYWWAVAIVGLFCWAPLTIDLSRRVMSEPVFVAGGLFALILAERAVRGQQGPLWYVWMSLALTFVLFTRTIGIILLLSVGGYLFWVKGRLAWRDIVLVGTTMVVILGIILATTVVQASDLWPSTYLRSPNASFLQMFDIRQWLSVPTEVNPAVTNPESLDSTGLSSSTALKLIDGFLIRGLIWHMGNHYRKIIIPIGGDENSKEQAIANRLGVPSLPLILGYLIFGLLILGYMRWIWQEGLSVFNLFGIFYLGSLSLWSWDDIRLLYPIQPQMQLAFLIGVEAVLITATVLAKSTNITTKWMSRFLIAFVLLILGISGVKSLLIQDSRTHIGDLEVRTEWIKSHTEHDAIMMTEAPVIDFIYSQRKSVPFNTRLFNSAHDLEAHLVQNNVGYILIAPQITWQQKYEPSYSRATHKLLSLLEELGPTGRLTLVYRSADTLIQVLQYELRP